MILPCIDLDKCINSLYAKTLEERESEFDECIRKNEEIQKLMSCAYNIGITKFYKYLEGAVEFENKRIVDKSLHVAFVVAINFIFEVLGNVNQASYDLVNDIANNGDLNASS